MDRAYTADYQVIKAINAIKGRRYFCPICNGELHFYPGTKNTPHFRHGQGVPKEVKDNCELYSRNFGDQSVYDQEFSAKRQVRLVLNKTKEKYIFELKFPLIQQAAGIVHHRDIYFSYYCEQLPEFKLNTVHLLPARKNCNIKTQLINKYTFYCANQKYEKMLGLHISGIYEPFKDGPLIFKEIQGEYTSLPYRRLTLSGRFFIVSTRQLKNIHPDIEVISTICEGNVYIYELIMPIEFSDDLQNWFNRVVGYNLLASTCHLDIVKPVTFRKNGTTIELKEYKSSWLVTNIGIRNIEQRVILIGPNNIRQVMKVPKSNIVELNLSGSGDYLLYVDQEITEMITIRYNKKLECYHSFEGEITVNNTDTIYKVRKLETEKVNLQTDLSLVVHTENELSYDLKHGGQYQFKSPIRIDFPTLWSLEIQKPLGFTNEIVVNDILTIYEKHHLYPKVNCTMKELQILKATIEKCNSVYKNKILYFIHRFGMRVPKPIAEKLKELEFLK